MENRQTWGVVPPSPLEPSPTPPPPPTDPFGRPAADARRRSLRDRAGAAGAALVALLAKGKAVILFLPKIKVLSTSVTALVSVAAYSLFFGWAFAAGFVVLLFIHEMGHVIALRREGIKASAPMFIPFLGAVITAKSLGENALAEARVGLAGPLLGSLAAALVAVAGAITGSGFLQALAYVGFLLNLFNLLPVVPLDGGRAMAAMAPWMWFVGFAALVALFFVAPNGILLIIIFFGGLETWRRWQRRKTRSLEQAAYYRVSPRNRLLVGAVYLGLIAALALGMSATYVQHAVGFAHY
ncbi:MAG TPA: site-2 protease family protein [Solirubrobacteraceae bacterium]|nr:site-2 protease family protein [Solirubrobacteraceae bacterium]